MTRAELSPSFSANLAIPSEERGVASELLLESRRWHNLRDKFVANGASESDFVEAIEGVIDLVTRSLRFSDARDPRIAKMDPDEFRDSPVVPCHGYTVVASELLDMLGIRHSVAKTKHSSHSFAVAYPGRLVYLLDFPLQLMGGDVRGFTDDREFLESWQITKEIELDVQRMLKNLSPERESFAVRRLNWLQPAIARGALALTLMPPSIGRYAISEQFNAKLERLQQDMGSN